MTRHNIPLEILLNPIKTKIAEMAMKRSKALGGSPQFWLNLQNNWEISQLNEAAFEDIRPVAA